MKKIILYSVFLVLATIFLAIPVVDDMFYTHLQVGEHIAKTTNITQEKVSLITEGQSWINHFWFYDLALFLGTFLWGATGYIFLGSFLWAITIIFLCNSKNIEMLCISTLMIFPILFAQDHLLLLVFPSLLIFFIYTKKTEAIYYYLIPLQIIWTNSHPSFVFVPFIVFCCFLSLNKPRVAFNAFCIVLLSTLINPYTYNIWLSAILYLWKFSNTNLWLWPGTWLWIIVVCWIYLENKDFDLVKNYRLLFFLAIIISAFYPNWLIATVFPTIFVFSRQNINIKYKKLYRVISVVAIAVLCILQIYNANYLKSDFSTTINNLLIENKRIYNDASIGGKISWQTKQLIFRDKRNIYPASVQNSSTMIRHNPLLFTDIENRYNLNAAIIDNDISYSKNICLWLTENPEWSLVCCNPQISMFLKNTPQNSEIISKNKIEDGKIEKQNYSYDYLYKMARYYFSINYVDSGKYVLEHLDSLDSSNPKLNILRAYMENYEGNLENACRYLEGLESKYQDLEVLRFLISTHIRLYTRESRKDAKIWVKFAEEKYGDDPEIQLYKAQLYYFAEDFVSSLATLRKIIQKYSYYSPAQRYYESIQANQIGIGSQEKYLKQAKELFVNQKYKQALKKLEQAIAINDNFSEAHLECGKIYHKLQMYDEAQNHYRRVLQLVPENKEAVSYLAITLSAIGKWQEAKKILDPIANEEVSYIQVAVSVVNDIVVKELLKKIQKNPRDFSLRIQLCKILAQERRFEEAIRYFKEIPNPDLQYLSFLYYEEGRQLLNEKKVEEGLDKLQESVKLWKEQREAYLLIGTIALKKKNWEEALKNYTEVLRIDPSDIRAKEGIAVIDLGKGIELQVQKKYLEAIAHFKKFIAKSSDEKEKKRIRERIVDMETTLDRFKVMALKNLYDQGENAFHRKDWDRFIRIHNTIIAKVPNAPQSYYCLAIAYAEKKEYNSAITYIEKALEYKPLFPEAHYFLSVIYLRLGDNGKAAHHENIYREQKNGISSVNTEKEQDNDIDDCEKKQIESEEKQ